MKNIFKSEKNYPVTKPFLPPIREAAYLLRQIWRSKSLTNNGAMHKKLEEKLKPYLKAQHISLCSNGTLGLLLALKALDIKGEVITTPYSFVATSHSILWNQLTPVFVDIDPSSFNIDPLQIEQAITDKTTAILAVHCYGNPCDTQAIQEIALRHNLKVIYDAAHAFGVELNNKSLFEQGDISIISFHATKVFNTFEGGAVISKDRSTKEYIDKLKNFGFENEISITDIGINAKMTEFSAGIGLLQLKYIDKVIKKREDIATRYMSKLGGCKHIGILNLTKVKRHNYAYFPVRILRSCNKSRDVVYEELKREGIYGRRYFYPLIPSFKPYKEYLKRCQNNIPNAISAASEIICLPLYPDLKFSDVDYISKMLVKIINE